MDINPLIADLNKYKEALIASIQIAIGFEDKSLSLKDYKRLISTPFPF